jgi:hypothetical protein
VREEGESRESGRRRTVKRKWLAAETWPTEQQRGVAGGAWKWR